MRNKRLLRTLSALCLTLVLASGFTVPASVSYTHLDVYKRQDKKGKSAQDSIPYERMWPDGICRVSDSHYTKTIQFQDINYQLSQNEDKTAIFELSLIHI